METHPCKTCGIEKPADQYYTQNIRGEPYRQKHCKPCFLRSEKRRRVNETPEQKAASTARKKRWESANAERTRENKARWYQEHKEQHAALVRNRRLIVSYGITIDTYAEMLAEQDAKCAACGSTDTGSKHAVFHVDHDHATGKVRALLCAGCNVALGAIHDDVSRMLALVEYLRRHEGDKA